MFLLHVTFLNVNNTSLMTNTRILSGALKTGNMNKSLAFANLFDFEA